MSKDLSCISFLHHLLVKSFVFKGRSQPWRTRLQHARVVVSVPSYIDLSSRIHIRRTCSINTNKQLYWGISLLVTLLFAQIKLQVGLSWPYSIIVISKIRQATLTWIVMWVWWMAEQKMLFLKMTWLAPHLLFYAVRLKKTRCLY